MAYTKRREPNNNDAVSALGITAFSWDLPATDYSKLSVPSGQTKPTESAIATKLAELRTEWNKSNYQRQRSAEYPKIGDQLDSLYKDILAGKVDSTGEFAKAIKITKDKYPKS